MPNSIAHVSQLLVEAHRRSRRIAERPPEVGPFERAEAFAIQDRVTTAMGGAGGWKTGAPSPEAEPIAAPLPAALIGQSPAALPATRFHALGVEAELAFRFARALPARDRPYGREEVLGAIESAHPAIEVVDSRLGCWAQKDAMWKLADNQSNGFFIHGPAATGWRELDLAQAPVELEIDGNVAVFRAEGGNPAGDPLRLATWLANHLAATRAGLRAGDVVTTGSCSGLIWVEPGQQVVARFPGIGQASVRFTARRGAG
jgi:2-keto-4-pentenoate hydratase